MTVTYTLNGEEFEFGIELGEDLREITRDIERHLLSGHPELRDHERLHVVVVDGVLDGLAGGRDAIALGDIAP